MVRKLVKSKLSIALALIISLATLVLLVQTGFAHGLSIEYPAPGEATVYNDAGFVKALQDKAIHYILFANDIKMTKKGVEINYDRKNPNLVIDGAGYTFTEYYVETRSTSSGIRIEKKGKVNTITVQNMNIVGQNGYGTIYVSSSPAVTLEYKDVTYTGPMLAYNYQGAVILDNVDVHIGYAQNGRERGEYMGEVVEAVKVTLRNEINIVKDNDGDHDKDGSNNEVFRIRHYDGSGGLFFDAGAVAQIKHNNYDSKSRGGFLYATEDSDGFQFYMGAGAKLYYMGYREFMQHGDPTSFIMEPGAVFDVNVREDAKRGLVVDEMLEIEGDFTVKENCIFSLVTIGTTHEALLEVEDNLYVGNDTDFSVVSLKNFSREEPEDAVVTMEGGKKEVKNPITRKTECVYNTATFDEPASLLIYQSNDLKPKDCDDDEWPCAIIFDDEGKLVIRASKMGLWDKACDYDNGLDPDKYYNNDTGIFNLEVIIDDDTDIEKLTVTDYTGTEPLTKKNFKLKKINVISLETVRQSPMPVPDEPITTGTPIIFGTGVPGSTVYIIWPDNTTSSSIVNEGGLFFLAKPDTVPGLFINDPLKFWQETPGLLPSEIYETTVSRMG